jgi:hypothetical protein
MPLRKGSEDLVRSACSCPRPVPGWQADGEVVAIDDAAVSFYRKHAFTLLLDSPWHLVLTIETVGQLLA